MKLQIQPLAFAALVLWLGGCAATSVKQTWKSPTYHGGPVQKVAVLAVDERDFYRGAVEGHFSSQLNAHDQSAFVTHDLLSLPAIQADKPAAAARLRDNGADALLLVRLVDSATYAHEVRATPAYFVPTVSGYADGGWYGCYSVAYSDMGTIWGNSTMKVCLDISLFDLKTGQRLWSGQTLTVLKEEMDRIEELSALVTKVLAALRQDGLIL